VSEKSPTNPLSLYAQSKIDSENEILRETADFFHPTVLRFATVFGHSRRPRFDLVANLFTAKGFFKEDITVFNSDQWRPLIHTKDIANAIVMTLEAPIEKVSRQIFNVGDDRMNYTISEIASMAQEIAAKDHKISVHHKDFAEDKRNYKVSFEKINKVLHFQSSVDLREGMEEMYNNFAKKVYKKHYSDSIYSNLEMTKFIKSEFYSEKYKKSHVTDFDLTNPSYATS
ncbi:MAG: NAD(P)-dependent oxidoreductase, partial [Candidatus Levybacteria bacterium]|nr:NAD(P)-dependent oxidoreductase [Candidatus Levybacteria bacterium]